MPDTISELYGLRSLEKADLASVVGWFQDVGDLAVFDRSARVPYDLPACERHWDTAGNADTTSGKCWFAITSAAREVVGIIGLEGISSINRDAVIPLYVDKPMRKKGIGIRAAALLLDFAFRQLGLQRVTSYYRADNLGSQCLTRQAGFKIEGTMRQSWFADGTFHDMIVVGILQDEWMARREALAAELGSETVIAFGGAASSRWSWPPQDPGSD